VRFRNVFRLDIHANLRLGATESPAADAGGVSTGLVDAARRRVGVEGEVGNVLQFQIERELASDERWRDVYVDYRQFEALRVQAGQFKLPFSLDELTGATNLDFVHRSRVADQLAPGRDRGVMIHGRPFTRKLRYELGVFDRDGRNARTANPERVHGGTTVAGRISVQPFAGSRSELADLRLGAAFTRGTLPEGFPALEGETTIGARFFRADVWVNGRRTRTGFEARWRPGPFSVQSEYIRAADERRGESVEGTDLSPVLATGWYVSGTWLVTGERKAGGVDTPRRPLLPKPGTGAIELAGRYETLGFRSAASGEPPSTSTRANVIVGNSLHSATFGVNWYVNRWIKLQANVVRERLDDPAQGPIPGRASYWNRLLLIQFAF
jgi:phosphate-selective porin OprO/OprP